MPKRTTTTKKAAARATPGKPAVRKPAPAARTKAKKAPKKAELKTQATRASVDGFIAKVDAGRRDDVRALDAMFRRVVGEPGAMWGASIVGYGSHLLRYPSGRELDWMITGFSPRAANLTLYLTDGFEGRQELLRRLGPHSIGRSCLYVKRLADLDTGVLEELVRRSVAAVRAR